MNSKELNKNIYFNVKQFAKRKGMNMGFIENKIGVSAGYFSRTLKYNSEISFSKVYKIAKVLDIPIDELTEDNRIKFIDEEIKRLTEEKAKIIKGGEEECTE